ncbi:MAG: cobalt ECF transporter T component CbiQ [Gemmatimonadetes bacterium]|nr:cobalt ECF transporter T component CbiQ [Gemmatimonadota bacterium]
MGFHHLDQYAAVESGLGHLAPAARVLGTVLIAVAAASLPPGAWLEMGAVAALVVALSRYAHVPLATFLLRATVPLAFLALASLGVLLLAPGATVARLGPVVITDGGIERLGAALLRGGAAIGAGVLLVSTTRFADLVEALRELRLPAAVTAALGLAYRFLYLLLDELAQVQRAAASRNAGAGRVPRRQLLLGVTASAATRSFARSERVHRAMLARGYTGSLPSLRPQPLDATSWRALLPLALLLAALVVSARVRS